MTEAVSSPFKPGDLLVITPQDDDDPVANALIGQRGSFHRLAHSGHVVLKMDETHRLLYFRLQDVRAYEVER